MVARTRIRGGRARALAGFGAFGLYSTVTTFAYVGFLVGPAAVGAVSEAATLRISLGTVAGLALVLALLFALMPLPRPYSSQ